MVRAGGGTKPQPSKLQQDYVLASRTDATRRQRVALRAVGYGLMFATGLAAFAFWELWEAIQQRELTRQANRFEVAAREIAVENQKKAVAEARQARVESSAQLAVQARSVLSDFPERGLLLAVEAVRTFLDAGDPSVPAAEQVLRDALVNCTGRPLRPRGARIGSGGMVVSPDGRWLAAASFGGVRSSGIWGAMTRRPA